MNQIFFFCSKSFSCSPLPPSNTFLTSSPNPLDSAFHPHCSSKAPSMLPPLDLCPSSVFASSTHPISLPDLYKILNAPSPPPGLLYFTPAYPKYVSHSFFCGTYRRLLLYVMYLLWQLLALPHCLFPEPILTT